MIWEIVVTAVISLSVSMAVNTTTHPVKAPLDFTEANFTVTPQSGEVPLTVTFEASVPTATEAATYHWDFRDGNQAVGSSVSHTYQYAGVYYPVLTISDGERVSTVSQRVHVYPLLVGEPPELDWTDPVSVQNFARYWSIRRAHEFGIGRLLEFVDPLEFALIESFTPDKKWVIFVARSFGMDGMPVPSIDYYLANLRTGNKMFLGRPGGLLLDNPSLSDDGSMIAFRARDDGDIYVMPMATMDPRRVIVVPDWVDGRNIAFKPDGTELALVVDHISLDDADEPLQQILRVHTDAMDSTMEELVIWESNTLALHAHSIYWVGDEVVPVLEQPHM